MQERLPIIKVPDRKEEKKDDPPNSSISTHSLNNFQPDKPTIREYFGEVYNTLCSQEEDMHQVAEQRKAPGVNSILFLEYTRLPKLINDRLFFAFSGHQAEEVSHNGTKHLPYISKEKFINGFELLLLGSLEKKLKLIFRMLDFNENNFISREDCRILLSHIPTPEAPSPTSLKKLNQLLSRKAKKPLLESWMSTFQKEIGKNQ